MPRSKEQGTPRRGYWLERSPCDAKREASDATEPMPSVRDGRKKTPFLRSEPLNKNLAGLPPRDQMLGCRPRLPYAVRRANQLAARPAITPCRAFSCQPG